MINKQNISKLITKKFPSIATGRIKAQKRLWVIGGDFVADTAHINLRLADPATTYTTRNYDVDVTASKQFNSNNPSLLSRLRNSLAHALNACSILPHRVVIVLEDELINDAKADENNMLKDYSRRVKWLMSEYRKLIDAVKDYLPPNAKVEGRPKFIWVMPTRHKNYMNNYSRRKFGQALEAQAKLVENNVALRIVQKWDYEDGNLFLFDEQRLTYDGKTELWKGVDKTIEFYDTKYTQKARPSSADGTSYSRPHEPMRRDHHRDHQHRGGDQKSRQRFWLPQPPSRK